MSGKPAVFLDRDNTLIRNDGDLGDPRRVELLQGAAMAVASLCGLGFKTIVVTNQGGVARGKYGEADVDAVHDRLAELVAEKANGAHLDAFYFCPFHPEGTVPEFTREHEDRKPQPGMLLRAAREHGLDLHHSWMIGDALRDVEAGKAAGCRTVWLCGDDDALRRAAEAEPKQRPDYVAGTLIEAVRIVASQRHSRDEPKDAAMHAAQSGPPGKRFDAAAMARLQRVPPKRDESMPEQPTPAPAASAYASPTSTAASKSVRPFRPYALPPAEEPDSLPAAPEATVKITKAKETLGKLMDRVRAPSERAETQPEPDRRSETPSPPTADEAASAGASEGQAAPDASESRLFATPAADPTDPELTKLARAILQELRCQRGGTGEYGPGAIFAVVLQCVAGIALLAGLWLGAESDGLFLRWLGVALIVQLAVVALLLGMRSGR
ncbi:MAG: HAD-IIIA family hydrolase [Planctomycetota bacterium]